jgi:hypothetical protein
VVSFTHQPLYPQGKSLWYPLNRRLGGHQSQYGHGGEKKNSQPLPGHKPLIIQPVAQCYTTELSWLIMGETAAEILNISNSSCVQELTEDSNITNTIFQQQCVENELLLLKKAILLNCGMMETYPPVSLICITWVILI